MIFSLFCATNTRTWRRLSSHVLPGILRVITSCFPFFFFFFLRKRKTFSGNHSEATLGFVIPTHMCMSCQNGAEKCAACSSSNKQPFESQQKPPLFQRNTVTLYTLGFCSLKYTDCWEHVIFEMIMGLSFFSFQSPGKLFNMRLNEGKWALQSLTLKIED